MGNLTYEELDQIQMLILFHIGYLSEIVSNTEKSIKNAKSKVQKSNDDYLEELEYIYDMRLKDLNGYKNIYHKIKKEWSTNG